MQQERLERYLLWLGHLPASREKKIEQAKAIYYALKGSVARDFGVDPTQQAMGLLPKLPFGSEATAIESERISKKFNTTGEALK